MLAPLTALLVAAGAGERVELLTARAELVAVVKVVAVVEEENRAGYAPPIGQVVKVRVVRSARGTAPAGVLTVFAARGARAARVGELALAYLSRTELDPVRWHYRWEQSPGSWHLENASGLIPIVTRAKEQAVFLVAGDDGPMAPPAREPDAGLAAFRLDEVLRIPPVRTLEARCVPCRFPELPAGGVDCTPSELRGSAPFIWSMVKRCLSSATSPAWAWRNWDGPREDRRLDVRSADGRSESYVDERGPRACMGRVSRFSSCPDGGWPWELQGCQAEVVCDELQRLEVDGAPLRCERDEPGSVALHCTPGASTPGGDAGLTLFCRAEDGGWACQPRPFGVGYELLW